MNSQPTRTSRRHEVSIPSDPAGRDQPAVTTRTWSGGVGAMTAVSGVLGLVAAGLLTLDVGAVGELTAMVQLGAVVGAPLALLLRHELRSRPVVIVAGIALSLALTVLAAQSLLWFGLAGRALLVLATTGYGMALAWLLVTADPERDAGVGPVATTEDGS